MSKPCISEKKRLLAVAFLALLVLITYANSVYNEFVWDDKLLIIQNRYVREPGHLGEIFTTNLFHGAGRPGIFYRPVQLLSYIGDYRLWGLRPFGFHLTNIILHMANSLLILSVLSRLIKNPVAAFASAALFAVHPAGCAAVTYIAGRADLLFLFFILLSLLFYHREHRATPGKTGLSYAAALAFYAFALFSKEMAVILPLLVVLTECCFPSARSPKLRTVRVLGYFLVLGFYVWLRLSFLRFRAGEPEFETLRQGVSPMLITYWAYLTLFLFPFRLHMERLNLPSPFPSGLDLASLILIGAGLVYLVLRRRRTTALFGSAWYFIALLPVANLVGLNAAMAEHWLYLPVIGLLIIAGSVFAEVLETGKPVRAAGPVVLLILLTLYSARTIVRNRDWKDSLTIFQHTVRHSPESVRAHNGLGSTYARMDRMEESIEELEKALALNPRHADARNNLGAVYGKIGRLEESVAELKQSLEINPRNPDAHNNLGAAYGKLGRCEESIIEFRKTLELDPYRFGVYRNLALSYLNSGNKAEAAQCFRRYLELVPLSEEESGRIKNTISRLEEEQGQQ